MPTIISRATSAFHFAGRCLHFDGDAGLGGEIEDVMILAGGRKAGEKRSDHELADRADVGVRLSQVSVGPFVVTNSLDESFDL